jgi:glycosyltransferase involved in cell wall biosynthesis
MVVIPNGVDLDRVAYDPEGRDKVRAELGIGSGDYVILLLGRLDANKRFDLAIEAAAPSLGPAAKVVVVGGGAERDHLEETARKCGVADSVVFAGERHDMAAVLSAADMLVASSRQETFGLCVLEALANGLRVLYTTCPALDGMDVESATEVPSTVDGMGAAIAAEVAAGHRPRQAEQAVADEFGITAVTGRIDDLYERLAGRLTPRALIARLRRSRLGRPRNPRMTWADVPRPTETEGQAQPQRADAQPELVGATSRGGDRR